MAKLTFLTLQQEVAAQAGLDQTVSATATLLQRWINISQQLVFQSFDWPFLKASNPLNLQTVKDYTTGTANTTLGSTSVTLSQTIATSVAGYYIQFGFSKDWFQITAHTGGSASITLDVGALSTNAADTLTIRKKYYSTNSVTDRILMINQAIFPFQLQEISQPVFKEVEPYNRVVGTPRAFLMAGQDSSGNPQFELWPTPDAAINLSVDYLIKQTDLSANGDTSPIPDKWNSVLIFGGKWQAFEYLDDSRSADAKTNFFTMIELMKQDYDQSLHKQRVMRAVDQQPSALLNYLPLPFNYPRGS
jgi:hypothetical protein